MVLFNILVCEDERNIRKLMCEYLQADNYNVFESENGEAALEILYSTHIDLLITDIMMPKMDGYALSNNLRTAGCDFPILMITAKETIDDKKKGFKSGTDDYMVKPIDMDEMLLRIAALLRRAKIASEKKLIVGNTIFNYENFTIGVNDVVLEIPKKEFMLIFKLLAGANKIFTRQQLMDEIWGYDTESDEQTVNVHISRLRERFEGNRDFEIITVKGLGYKAVKR
jgi:two-component system OmpR family response regulator